MNTICVANKRHHDAIEKENVDSVDAMGSTGAPPVVIGALADHSTFGKCKSKSQPAKAPVGAPEAGALPQRANGTKEIFSENAQIPKTGKSFQK